MIGPKVLIIASFLIASSVGYNRLTLNCKFVSRKNDLICFIYDLEIYTKLSRVVDVHDEMKGIEFQGLQIMSSSMYYLPNEIFKFLPNITELKILSDVPTLLEINGKDFVHLKKIKSVLISGQKIRRLAAQSFEGARTIVKMFLPSNNIETIDNDAFEDLENCLFLVLSNNRIKKVNKAIFEHMPNLWSVNLENNRILFFSDDTFGFNIVNVCDLSYNFLRWPPADIIQRVLISKPEVMLYSLKMNLCRELKDKIFTASTKIPELMRIADSCETARPQSCRSCGSCTARRNTVLSKASRLRAINELTTDEEELDEQLILEIYGENLENQDLRLVELIDENSRLKEMCGTNSKENYGREIESLTSGNNEIGLHSISEIIARGKELLSEHHEVISSVLDKLDKFIIDNSVTNEITEVSTEINEIGFLTTDAEVNYITTELSETTTNTNYFNPLAQKEALENEITSASSITVITEYKTDAGSPDVTTEYSSESVPSEVITEYKTEPSEVITEFNTESRSPEVITEYSSESVPTEVITEYKTEASEVITEFNTESGSPDVTTEYSSESVPTEVITEYKTEPSEVITEFNTESRSPEVITEYSSESVPTEVITEYKTEASEVITEFNTESGSPEVITEYSSESVPTEVITEYKTEFGPSEFTNDEDEDGSLDIENILSSINKGG